MANQLLQRSTAAPRLVPSPTSVWRSSLGVGDLVWLVGHGDAAAGGAFTIASITDEREVVLRAANGTEVEAHRYQLFPVDGICRIKITVEATYRVMPSDTNTLLGTVKEAAESLRGRLTPKGFDTELEGFELRVKPMRATSVKEDLNDE